MKRSEYTFTGFMSSGNPFRWYYDENKQTAFTTSIDVATWSKKPVKGDKIVMLKGDGCDGKLEQVFINGEQVYQRSPEKEMQQEEILRSINKELKQQKGF